MLEKVRGSSQLLQAASPLEVGTFPWLAYKASQQSCLQVTDRHTSAEVEGCRLVPTLFPTHSLPCLQGKDGHEAAPEQGTVQSMGFRSHTSLGAGNVFPWKGSEYFTSIN